MIKSILFLFGALVVLGLIYIMPYVFGIMFIVLGPYYLIKEYFKTEPIPTKIEPIPINPETTIKMAGAEDYEIGRMWDGAMLLKTYETANDKIRKYIDMDDKEEALAIFMTEGSNSRDTMVSRYNGSIEDFMAKEEPEIIPSEPTIRRFAGSEAASRAIFKTESSNVELNSSIEDFMPIQKPKVYTPSNSVSLTFSSGETIAPYAPIIEPATPDVPTKPSYSRCSHAVLRYCVEGVLSRTLDNVIL